MPRPFAPPISLNEEDRQALTPSAPRPTTAQALALRAHKPSTAVYWLHRAHPLLSELTPAAAAWSAPALAQLALGLWWLGRWAPRPCLAALTRGLLQSLRRVTIRQRQSQRW